MNYLIFLIPFAIWCVVAPRTSKRPGTSTRVRDWSSRTIISILTPIEITGYKLRWGDYDTDGNGQITRKEANDLMELDQDTFNVYWERCDEDPANGWLDWFEWLVCAGEWNDSGEELLVSEWDSFTNEGILMHPDEIEAEKEDEHYDPDEEDGSNYGTGKSLNPEGREKKYTLRRVKVNEVVTSLVFLDITIDGDAAGRIEIELFGKVAPKTSENFRALCTGEKGDGKTLHYRGTPVHQIADFLISAGDITEGNGEGGESIYGLTFPDETFTLMHSEPGLVAMVNKGPDTNGAQFSIILRAAVWLDEKNIVFGRVIQGMDVVQKIFQLERDEYWKPPVPVMIVDSGELPMTEDAKERSKKAEEEEIEKEIEEEKYGEKDDEVYIPVLPKSPQRNVADNELVTARVFLEITIGDDAAGRIEIELFGEVAPRTSENFRALCTGEKGDGQSGKALHYRKSPLHRVIPNFMIQGGDTTLGNGFGGESIYGLEFDDETFELMHSEPGLLCMANKGPNTNGAQFFITLAPTPWLDGKHVIFGRVSQGMDVVQKIAEQGSEGGKTKVSIMVSDSGELLPYLKDPIKREL